MKSAIYVFALAATIAAGALLFRPVFSQGTVRPPVLRPREIVIPKPSETLPLSEVNRIPLAKLLARKAFFKPLEKSMTLVPLNPLGPNGALYGGHVRSFDFIEGTMKFLDKYGNVGVYFRPTASGATYVAEFTIEVHEPGPVRFSCHGTDVDFKSGNKAVASFELTKGVHHLTAPIRASNADFVFAQTLSHTDQVTWSLKSVTITKT